MIIGMAQTKGGVGKTSICLNLAAEFARRGKTVHVFDADPSGHSVTLASEATTWPFKVEALLLEETDDAGMKAWAGAVKGCKADVVIIDAPGALGAAFGAVIAMADVVLIPSGATVLDINGAVETLKMIRAHRKATKHARPDVLIVPSKIDKRTTAGRDAVLTLAGLTEPVAPAIGNRSIVADSFASSDTVPPDSQAGREFSALADAIETKSLI